MLFVVCLICVPLLAQSKLKYGTTPPSLFIPSPTSHTHPKPHQSVKQGTLSFPTKNKSSSSSSKMAPKNRYKFLTFSERISRVDTDVLHKVDQFKFDLPEGNPSSTLATLLAEKKSRKKKIRMQSWKIRSLTHLPPQVPLPTFTTN
eukprot:TRINITY_DN413_c0_g1_i2.p3 TRINITY_DN413_c0_g1~~TRINITY_DN413_c0_g1_i2.p3  ORF type:complete len:146 (-),score=21.15 TRINITY_DN413_c0_g1_i2:479-916(-)